jgi:hypothetical protein
MARIGKIARLNPAIRTQPSSRLAGGADGQHPLHCLNSLPPVRETLARPCDARSINQQNLSHWRSVGYHDWLAQNRDRSCLVKVIRACPRYFSQSLDKD